MKTGLTVYGKCFVILFAALIVLALQGCVYRSYHEGTTTYTSIGLLAGSQVGPFTLEAGKKDADSYRKLQSQGVANDATTVVEAAITAAIKASKP